VRLRETFTEETGIQAGDVLTVSGVDYPVKVVEVWSAQGRLPAYVHLVVEELLQ
jgi:hypothetical protein